MRGTLFGIGVGPGDPELMTIKAVRYIKEADVLCLPRAFRENCRAYQIAKQTVPEIEEKECLCCDFKMTRDADELARLHREIYKKIQGKLGEGKNVAFLTVGDSLTYSTFSYLLDKAKSDGIAVEIVSGVTSYHAAAARAGISLCEGNEELHIGTGASDIKRLLDLPGTKVIMKAGKKAREVKAALEQAEREREAQVFAVSNCGLPEEEKYFGAARIPLDYYMTTIVIKPGIRA